MPAQSHDRPKPEDTTTSANRRATTHIPKPLYSKDNGGARGSNPRSGANGVV